MKDISIGTFDLCGLKITPNTTVDALTSGIHSMNINIQKSQFGEYDIKSNPENNFDFCNIRNRCVRVLFKSNGYIEKIRCDGDFVGIPNDKCQGVIELNEIISHSNQIFGVLNDGVSASWNFPWGNITMELSRNISLEISYGKWRYDFEYQYENQFEKITFPLIYSNMMSRVCIVRYDEYGSSDDRYTETVKIYSNDKNCDNCKRCEVKDLVPLQFNSFDEYVSYLNPRYDEFSRGPEVKNKRLDGCFNDCFVHMSGGRIITNSKYNCKPCLTLIMTVNNRQSTRNDFSQFVAIINKIKTILHDTNNAMYRCCD